MRKVGWKAELAMCAGITWCRCLKRRISGHSMTRCYAGVCSMALTVSVVGSGLGAIVQSEGQAQAWEAVERDVTATENDALFVGNDKTRDVLGSISSIIADLHPGGTVVRVLLREPNSIHVWLTSE